MDSSQSTASITAASTLEQLQYDLTIMNTSLSLENLDDTISVFFTC